MAKGVLIILTLIFIVGCGEKKIEVAPKVEEVKNSTTNEEANILATEEEFVPAHIANSTIESVPH